VYRVKGATAHSGQSLISTIAFVVILILKVITAFTIQLYTVSHNGAYLIRKCNSTFKN